MTANRYPAFDDMGRLTRRGPELWSVSAPLELARVPIGRRVLVVRGGGELAVVSPFPLPSAIVDQIRALGTVRALVVPTLFHDTRFEEAVGPFDEAPVFAPEGFAPAVAPPGGIRPIAELPCGDFALRECFVEGMPKVRETVFLHVPSATLLVSDLLFHFPAVPGAWSRLLTRLLGIHGPPAVSRFFRAHVRDRQAFRRSLTRILALDFDQALPSHGAPIPSKGDARRALERAEPSLAR
jgi:hypothetical protein